MKQTTTRATTPQQMLGILLHNRRQELRSQPGRVAALIGCQTRTVEIAERGQLPGREVTQQIIKALYPRGNIPQNVEQALNESFPQAVSAQ